MQDGSTVAAEVYIPVGDEFAGSGDPGAGRVVQRAGIDTAFKFIHRGPCLADINGVIIEIGDVAEKRVDHACIYSGPAGAFHGVEDFVLASEYAIVEIKILALRQDLVVSPQNVGHDLQHIIICCAVMVFIGVVNEELDEG